MAVDRRRFADDAGARQPPPGPRKPHPSPEGRRSHSRLNRLGARPRARARVRSGPQRSHGHQEHAPTSIESRKEAGKALRSSGRSRKTPTGVIQAFHFRDMICGTTCVNCCFYLFNGGEGGIRTPGRLAPSTDFESAPFGHSGTSPGATRTPRAKLRIVGKFPLDSHRFRCTGCSHRTASRRPGTPFGLAGSSTIISARASDLRNGSHAYGSARLRRTILRPLPKA